MIGGRTFNDMDRSDIDWGVRGGAGSQPLIPRTSMLDPGSLAYGRQSRRRGAERPPSPTPSSSWKRAPITKRATSSASIPGGSWQINDLMHLDFQVNASRSHFFRDSPTYLFVTCPSDAQRRRACRAAPRRPAASSPISAIRAGAAFPTITTNIDLNNPANFQWSNGRVNLQDEQPLHPDQRARICDYHLGRRAHRPACAARPMTTPSAPSPASTPRSSGRTRSAATIQTCSCRRPTPSRPAAA